MQGAQRGGRLEAELVVQDRTGPGVHLERVRLPPGLVQGRHQQPGESLLGRVRADDRVEVGDDVGGPAERQQQLRALGQRRQAQLGEPGRLHRRPRLVGEVRERLAAPPGQRRAVQPGRLDVRGVVLAVAAGAGSADTAATNASTSTDSGATSARYPTPSRTTAASVPASARRSFDTRSCSAFDGSAGRCLAPQTGR